MVHTLDITTDQGFKALTLLRHQAKLDRKPLFVFIGPAPENHITQRQFNAMHLWCERVADQLNDAGLDMKAVLKPEVDIPWGKESVKEHLWKPVLLAITGKQSSKDQTSEEITQVLNTINRHLGQKLCVTLPEWPHNG